MFEVWTSRALPDVGGMIGKPAVGGDGIFEFALAIRSEEGESHV